MGKPAERPKSEVLSFRVDAATAEMIHQAAARHGVLSDFLHSAVLEKVERSMRTTVLRERAA